MTAKEIDKLADSMLKKTGIDDEAIKTSENMLLTFTNIRNETGKNNRIFDRATESVADLATAMNQGAVPSADQMQRASIQLGKALNDPIKGIGALSRVGIQFTDQQKDQIEALVEGGKTIEAQKIILAELNKEVGGRAAAAGKTFAGQWRIMIETLNNLSGTLAAKLMPTIQKYLQIAVRWLSNSKNQKMIIDTVTLGGAGSEERPRCARHRIQSGDEGHRLDDEHAQAALRRLIAIKTLQMASALAGIVGGIDLIGRTAKVSTAQVRLLRLSLIALRLLGPVGIPGSSWSCTRRRPESTTR